MNIVQFIGYLNREKGWNLQGSYYAYIDQWRQWWQGNYPDFHDVPCIGADGQRHKRPMYRLRMPKQACEDWAALLLGAVGREEAMALPGGERLVRWLRLK